MMEECSWDCDRWAGVFFGREQLPDADRAAEVVHVSFYDGGDVLCGLRGRGTWHEECASAVRPGRQMTGKAGTSEVVTLVRQWGCKWLAHFSGGPCNGLCETSRIGTHVVSPRAALGIDANRPAKPVNGAIEVEISCIAEGAERHWAGAAVGCRRKRVGSGRNRLRGSLDGVERIVPGESD